MTTKGVTYAMERMGLRFDEETMRLLEKKTKSQGYRNKQDFVYELIRKALTAKHCIIQSYFMALVLAFLLPLHSTISNLSKRLKPHDFFNLSEPAHSKTYK